MEPHSCSKFRGQVLLQAVIALAVVGSLVVAVPQVIKYLNQRSKISKVKSAMASAEAAIRLKLSSPQAFGNCDFLQTTGSCKLVESSVAVGKIIKPVLGAECPTTPVPISGCGVVIKQAAQVVVPATSTSPLKYMMELTLAYQGLEVQVKDIVFRTPIPERNQNKALCSAALPVFQGLNSSTGLPICGPLPNTCGPGFFMNGYNPTTLVPICMPFPTDLISCSANQFINRIQFGANLKVKGGLGCRTRLSK
jgi:hypothetical protein